MSGRAIGATLGSATAFVGHMGLQIRRVSLRAGQWITTESDVDPLRLYIAQQEYFIGLSYAAAVGFTIWSFLTFLSHRKTGAKGLVGGLTLTGLLYFGGCFLLGCCGSPMLPVYLGLFGPSVLGLAKPVTFGFTLLSVGIGLWWLRRKTCAPTIVEA